MNFDLSGTNPTAWSSTGTFIGTPIGVGGPWNVTNATGTFNGIAITGVLSTTNNGNIFYFNNKYYWPGPPVVDNAGIVVTLADGGLVNYCYDSPNCANPGAYAALLWEPGVGTTFYNADSASFTQHTPEPATLALFGSSVLGLVGVMRRRIL